MNELVNGLKKGPLLPTVWYYPFYYRSLLLWTAENYNFKIQSMTKVRQINTYPLIALQLWKSNQKVFLTVFSI